MKRSETILKVGDIIRPFTLSPMDTLSVYDDFKNQSIDTTKTISFRNVVEANNPNKSKNVPVNAMHIVQFIDAVIPPFSRIIPYSDGNILLSGETKVNAYKLVSFES